MFVILIPAVQHILIINYTLTNQRHIIIISVIDVIKPKFARRSYMLFIETVLCFIGLSLFKVFLPFGPQLTSKFLLFIFYFISISKGEEKRFFLFQFILIFCLFFILDLLFIVVIQEFFLHLFYTLLLFEFIRRNLLRNKS